jgi:hypothetical protein
VAGLLSFVFIVAYSATFLLMRKWWLPLPLYVEHSLFPLFTTAAVAGYWAALLRAHLALKGVRGSVAAPMRKKQSPATLSSATPLSSRPAPRIFLTRLMAPAAAGLTALLVAAFVPAAATVYASHASRTAPNFDIPFPNEPELVRYLGDAIGLRVGGEFRGSLTFVAHSVYGGTMFNLWNQSIPTANEYSQLFTPQVLYLNAALFKHDIYSGELNHFVPWVGRNGSFDVLFKTLPALGVRYVARYTRVDAADQRHFPIVTMPRRPVGDPPGDWFVYELPNPNLGNYSPTGVVTAKSSAEIIASLGAPHFDFTKQVVLSSPIDEPLVPAHDMRLTLIRGGLHVSGSSDGTSLVVLPQQFSHCLHARDSRVRLVRANLLMTGMIFSGNVDADIVFDYGVFSPGCRRIDLAELSQLIERQAPKDERIFVDWAGAVARLRDAAMAIGLLAQKPLPAPPPATETIPPGEPSASGPVITKETVLADLPPLTTSGFAFIGIQGLNAEVEAGDPVVVGQRILRLVAVPTTGRHYLAAQSTTLNKNQVYRITAWIKDSAGVKVEMQVSDELTPRHGTPANYGTAIFDPAARTISSSPGRLKGRGMEQRPEGWQKIWVDLATAGGEFVLAFGLVSKDRNSFKGDGRLGLTFGGIEVAERN